MLPLRKYRVTTLLFSQTRHWLRESLKISGRDFNNHLVQLPVYIPSICRWVGIQSKRAVNSPLFGYRLSTGMACKICIFGDSGRVSSYLSLLPSKQSQIVFVFLRGLISNFGNRTSRSHLPLTQLMLPSFSFQKLLALPHSEGIACIRNRMTEELLSLRLPFSSIPELRDSANCYCHND